MHVILPHAPVVTGTTINQSGAWTSVCEPTDPRWREAIVAGKSGGDTNLCGAQLSNYGSGHEIVHPVWCIRGYWYLRNQMNLGSTHPAGHGHYKDLATCLNAAIAWHSQRPSHREVVAYTSDVAQLFLGKVGDPYPGRVDI